MAVHTEESNESLTIWGQAEGVASRPSEGSTTPGGSRFCALGGGLRYSGQFGDRHLRLFRCHATRVGGGNNRFI